MTYLRGPGSSLPGTMTADPVAFSLLSEVWILVLHPLNHHDREVIYGVSRGVEMGGHWFLELLVANVAAVSFEVDMERVLCGEV